MTIRSVKTGVLNTLRGANSIIAKPDTPTTPVATLYDNDFGASIAFTPTTLGVTATLFTATSNPGSVTSTSATSPITYADGLLDGSTSYTFTVRATNANGDSPESAASNSITTAGKYVLLNTYNTSGTFTVPAGVNTITAFVVGGGGSGDSGQGWSPAGYGFNAAGGGAGGSGSSVAFFENYAVTPAQTYDIVIGAGGGGASSIGTLLSVGPTNTVSGNATRTHQATFSGGGAGGAGNNGGGTAASSTAVTVSTNLVGIGSVSLSGSNGGGGGAGNTGGGGAAGGPGSGAGGGGSGGNNAKGGAGGGANAPGGAGGGGGGGGNQGGGDGGAGAAGRIIIYGKGA